MIPILVGLAFLQSELPEAPGRGTVMRICGNCHHPRILVGRELSEDAWAAVVGEMMRRGARVAEDDFDVVVGYLAKNIKAAPVNVNRAGVEEIARELNLTAGEAAAIVEGRKKGEFRTLADVKRVVEARKIERSRHRIVF